MGWRKKFGVDSPVHRRIWQEFWTSERSHELERRGEHVGGFPKLGVPFFGIPIIRTIVCRGLCWGSLILGNYHVNNQGSQGYG